MLVPPYALGQTTNSLVIDIKAPDVKTKDIEVAIDKYAVTFKSKSYRLTLDISDMELADSGERAAHDVSTGILSIDIPKKNPGQFYDDLNNVVVQPRSSRAKRSDVAHRPSSVKEVSEDQQLIKATIIAASIRWNYQGAVSVLKGYGFQDSYIGVFEGLNREGSFFRAVFGADFCPESEVIGHSTTHVEGQVHKHVEQSFCEDSVIVGLEEIEVYEEALDFVHWWDQFTAENLLLVAASLDSLYTSNLLTYEASAVASTVAAKTFKFKSEMELRRAIFSVASVVYAFCFSQRIYSGRYTDDAVLKFLKCSSSLSHFHVPVIPRDFIVEHLKRALVFPKHRSLFLHEVALEDVINVLCMPKSVVLKILIDIKLVLGAHPDAWRLCTVFIDDMISWVHGSGTVEYLFRALSEQLSLCKIDYRDVHLGIWSVDQLMEIASVEMLHSADVASYASLSDLSMDEFEALSI